MSAPLFRRIAIFQPDLVLTTPNRPQADRQMLGELAQWQAQVRAAGADAVYARVEAMAPTAQETFLTELLAADLQVLAPAHHFRAELQPAAWHFKRSSVRPASPVLQALTGRSCHSHTDVQRAQQEGMDYVFLSPVFSTASHPGAPALGLDNLRNICAEVDIPVFALGGLTAAREKDCREAGAYGIAGIRMFLR